MTGTNFLNTPDGRSGWADYFMKKGYEVGMSSLPHVDLSLILTRFTLLISRLEDVRLGSKESMVHRASLIH